MSNAIRNITRASRALARPTTHTPARSFHSPFAVLGNSSQLTAPPPPSSNVYDKQTEEFTDSFSDARTYVVCQPTSSYYAVPSGAYPTSAPYVNFTATEAPNKEGAALSSTSSNPFAHPITRRAPQNASGVGESAAVRNAEAPGELGARGGSHGGLGLMDKAGTKPGDGTLASRNPPPDGKVAERNSKLGLENAWKERK
ncbi:hypothetical protein HGRIS_003552 [Hohenbuehelia grisea]|uniref:Uncharacterized protein n=1 Tax=Hohenbuehelia grisea TaxID=104357 RepID=A0ABR3JGE0_9AGAR